MDKKPYMPTDPKATHVAGQRIRKLPIHLTASQAEHELRVGAITPFVERAEKQKKG
ncbi:hypothetical protein [Bosea massiliensis]|uniref:Uncharacterized protein n=1 Tax=Bosea massiliensis TaxID=151419 RepID=A0ABW0PBN6_9HYPH